MVDNTPDKLIVFHGADHKVGTTMLAVSVAELFAEAGNNTAFLALNGRQSTEYFGKGAKGIDDIKDRLESRILDRTDLENITTNINGVNVLGGVCDEEMQRQYSPMHAEHLIKVALEVFDIVIIDSGSELDNGLALGALQYSECNILICTQQESSLARWEKRRGIYEKLGISTYMTVINKYNEKDIYTGSYICKRIKVDDGKTCHIKSVSGSSLAEIEQQSLLSLGSPGFKEDIAAVLSHTGYQTIAGSDVKRKKRWLSFI